MVELIISCDVMGCGNEIVCREYPDEWTHFDSMFHYYVDGDYCPDCKNAVEKSGWRLAHSERWRFDRWWEKYVGKEGLF